MKQDFIWLKNNDFNNLKVTVNELLNSMVIAKCSIYQHKNNYDFILIFPEKISNERFIFFYCALMAPDLANSTEQLGWFYANDDTTMYEKSGDFSSFKRSTYFKRIMITPQGDEKTNLHQYGVTEIGKEIHFGMDGSFKVQEKSNLKYINPVSNLIDYNHIALIEKPIREINQTKTIFGKLKRLTGI